MSWRWSNSILEDDDVDDDDGGIGDIDTVALSADSSEFWSAPWIEDRSSDTRR